MTSDLDLLRQFARENSQDAFAEIVRRHLNLVYSAALRQVLSPQLAEEVAQSVFADLARSGTGILPVNETNSLTPWLYSVTRRTAIDVIRKESRRQLREQIAVEMQTMNATANDWTQIAPLLDDAMTALDETDRAAILLRYFENKNLREVGESLNISDDAAQKRVSRAVERLRELFLKQNAPIGAGSLAVLISANAVQSAPVALGKTVIAVALAKGATAGSSTLTLAKGALKLMAWKTKTTLIAGAIILFAAGTVAISNGWLKKPQGGKTGTPAQILITTAIVTAPVAAADAVLKESSKPQTTTDPSSKAFRDLIALHPEATITSTPRIVALNGNQAVVEVTRAVQING
ncbi:MAG TPA: sigma-70 family RNA polymerase sigma factor, partial [Candidatus Baltobacteraceae bacterium]|nr:sigma-70 family RNA polymerase sigma factor [Candidatus Baltobacteraceae bacterium]